MMNNYHNRRKRGQCASCTNQATLNAVRCLECQEKHNEQWNRDSEATNARRRERAFQRSLERERRLETLDMLLQVEVSELEKVFCRRIGSVVEQAT